MPWLVFCVRSPLTRDPITFPSMEPVWALQDSQILWLPRLRPSQSLARVGRRRSVTNSNRTLKLNTNSVFLVGIRYFRSVFGRYFSGITNTIHTERKLGQYFRYFFVSIWLVFLRYYQYHTEGKLGQYFWYQKFGGSPSKNWREPPFS